MSDGVYVEIGDLVRLKYQAKGFSFLPRQPVHSLLSGQKASRLRGRGLNFEEIRRYLPGDDIRSIDWKITARMRQTHSRVFTEERDRPMILVVDQRIGMFFGSQRAMKSVVAAQAAALGAWRALDVGDRVGALIFNDQDLNVIKPRRSTKTVMQVLASIVRMNNDLAADGGAVSVPGQLNVALENTCRIAKHDALVCVISDFAGSDETTAKLMTRLARHNDVIVGFVHDPLEAEMPDIGRALVGDGQMQVEFDASDTALRQKYSDSFGDFRARAQQFLLQRRVPIISLNTTAPVGEQIRKVLGYRPGRKTSG